MQIVAQRGNGERLLLVDDDDQLGQVYERALNRLYPKHEPAAILKFGYWQDYDGDEDADAIARGAAEA